MKPRPPLLAGLDPELSAHLAAALTRYQRWLEDIGRPKPDGFEDLLGSTIAVVRGGQSHPVDAATRQRVRVGHFLTTADAATVLGCSQRTVRRRVADGTLPAHRIGRLVRFDAHDILALGTAA